MSCTRTQRSDAGEARTRGPSVPSQALYHLATKLPLLLFSGLLMNVLLHFVPTKRVHRPTKKTPRKRHKTKTPTRQQEYNNNKASR